MKIGITSGAFCEIIKNEFKKLNDDTLIIVNPKEVFDLYVFSGGCDVNPKLYNEKNTMSYYSPTRDLFETEVFITARKNNKKIFGICRGHQLINVLLGGSLFQHINEHPDNHQIFSTEKSGIIPKLFSITNSLHHQAIKKIGNELEITSITSDGIIESTENDKIITVQFHPEIMYNSDELFKYIVNWSI